MGCGFTGSFVHAVAISWQTTAGRVTSWSSARLLQIGTQLKLHLTALLVVGRFVNTSLGKLRSKRKSMREKQSYAKNSVFQNLYNIYYLI